MLKIRKLLEDRKYRKKYNSLKLVYDDLLTEKNILVAEVEMLNKQIKKLLKERNKDKK